MEPLVAHLRRFALDDGPGIRTTVFLKGCPLACRWCHNPECIDPRREVLFHAGYCVHERACAVACPHGAISPLEPGVIDRDRCDGCGRCAFACPAGALELSGEAVAPDALVALLLRDRPFYDASGGGVTLSGGEPTLHLGYVSAVARALHREGVHVALQTCGLFALDAVRAALLPFVDLVHFDLKLADPEAHARLTGRGNATILENFRALAAELPAGRLVARVPLVPGITATRENLLALGALVRAAGVPHVLLPWNPGALAKRAARGESPDPALPERLLRGHELAAAAAWFEGREVPVAAAARPPPGGPP